MIVLWFSSSPSPLLLLGPQEDIREVTDEKRLLGGKLNSDSTWYQWEYVESGIPWQWYWKFKLELIL